MKNNILIVVLTLIWLVLMANIIWNGNDGRWMIEDVEKIDQLEVAKYTNQVIVVAVSDEGTTLCLYERDFGGVEEQENLRDLEIREKLKGNRIKWRLVFETEAVIGKNGLGKTKEGDGKTPVGVFLFVKAFGILENPGAKVEYTQVDESYYWVDDSGSKYYNQFIDVNKVVPDWKSAEHIVEYGECYHYVLATSFNTEKIPGVGSAVFLHCMSRDGNATAGCIAIPEVYMRELLKRVLPECVIIIDQRENILSY